MQEERLTRWRLGFLHDLAREMDHGDRVPLDHHLLIGATCIATFAHESVSPGRQGQQEPAAFAPCLGVNLAARGVEDRNLPRFPVM